MRAYGRTRGLRGRLPGDRRQPRRQADLLDAYPQAHHRGPHRRGRRAAWVAPTSSRGSSSPATSADAPSAFRRLTSRRFRAPRSPARESTPDARSTRYGTRHGRNQRRGRADLPRRPGARPDPDRGVPARLGGPRLIRGRHAHRVRQPAARRAPFQRPVRADRPDPQRRRRDPRARRGRARRPDRGRPPARTAAVRSPGLLSCRPN